MAVLRDGEGSCISGGVRLWYRVDGARHRAMPLLLLHGGPGATARPFETSIGPLLALGRPVIYQDCRGAGRSERPADVGRYSLAQLARDTEALREALAIERWAVFGHSLGAATAIVYAAAHSQHVTALILCAPLIHGPANLDASLAQKVARAPAEARAEARRIYRSDHPLDEKFEAALSVIDQPTRYGLQFYDADHRHVMDAIQAGLADEIGRPLMDAALWEGLSTAGLWQFDGFSYLPRLPMPQLMLLSPFDSEISIDAAVRYVAAADAAALTLFRHSGHHPYLEEPAACALAIDEFLASCDDAF